MSANPEIERELAEIRADPRYGVEGSDDDLLLRELDLLIRQAYEIEAERFAQRRKPRRGPAPATPRQEPVAPATLAPVPVLPLPVSSAPATPIGPRTRGLLR